ncbi:hypothetical protein C8J57DRAFT_1340484 [Mycena rebaudengoi]|nr:hypothetical protein C8J57DRAFT_1340484 [Mycena rebaudengoi]
MSRPVALLLQVLKSLARHHLRAVVCPVMLRRSDPPVDAIFSFCDLEKGGSLTDARYRLRRYVYIILFRSFCANSGPRICPRPPMSPLLLEEYRVGMGCTTTSRCVICPYSSIFSGFSLD